MNGLRRNDASPGNRKLVTKREEAYPAVMRFLSRTSFEITANGLFPFLYYTKYRLTTGGFIFTNFMQPSLRHIIHNNTFWLSSERCIYWEEQQALILSDLHFGKTGHFRKSGIAVPQSVFKEDLQRLFAMVQFYNTRQLIIVGDMFHSHENKEMELFTKWRNDLGGLNIHLIKGNHDILNNSFYSQAGIDLSDCHLQVGNIGFVHDPAAITSELPAADYYFTGHMHPGISMYCGSRQTLSFPCYYFGARYAVLPAYSKFAGFVNIKPKARDNVYAIVNQSLVQVQ
ncbi:MAG TPA: ligase-associated DNA damage response endonuclease PdeM [Panacibacter sp.]|nr:ligase-associated DNA damage response endonuclease PdeM [Panacibacter sp.]